MAFASVGCGRLGGDGPDEPFVLNGVQVAGSVYDRSTGEPIRGADLVLCAYDESDLQMQTPIATSSTIAYLQGSYSFRIASPPSTRTWRLSASADGHKTASMDIFIDSSTSSYDIYFKSFKVESVDFFLETL